MKLSFATKMVVVSLLIGVCATHTHARRLYKWVDESSVTNYSEFQPKEGSSRKVEVLESRGEHVDPAMAVTAEMKAIEIPVDVTGTQGLPASAVQPAQLPTTQTIVKQGVIAAPYTRSASEVVTTTTFEKKEQPVVAADKKESIVNPFADKAASTAMVAEKKEEVIEVVQAEKKVQPKVNPWTRTVEFMPSNLVPENLPKTKKP